MNANIEKYYIRNAHNNDFQSVHRLLSLKSSKFFGPSKRKIFDPVSFFEIYSTHSIIIKEKESDDNIIGYAEIKHYPKIPVLPKDTWMDWLHHHYCVSLPISLSNTLFVNYFVFDTKYCPELVGVLFTEVFFREYCVRYIISVEPPYQSLTFKEDEPDFTVLENFATKYFPKDFSVISCKNTQKLHIVFRDDVIPKMRYRKALPEDNDEIVEIIDQDRPVIKKELGDYYIAEELLASHPHKTLIVTEVSNQTVGFIWLNTNIATIKLIKNFQLETYDNLLKFSPDEYWRIMTHDYNDLVHKPIEDLFVLSTINKLYNEKDKPAGPFELKSEISSTSIFSHFSLPVLTASSATEIEQECEFVRRESAFKRFKLLEERLKNTDWYIQKVERTFRMQYNSYIGIAGEVLTSNAFALQLYGLCSSNDFRKVFRFLLAAFSSYPDRDYCIFSTPLTWRITPSLKQLIRYFVRVMPRADSQIDDIIYITHRACIMGDLSIHEIQEEDVKQLKILLTYDPNSYQFEVPSASNISRQFRRSRTSARVRHASRASLMSTRSFKQRASNKLEDGSKTTISKNPSNQGVSKETSKVFKKSMSTNVSKQRISISKESPRSTKQQSVIGKASSTSTQQAVGTETASLTAKLSKQSRSVSRNTSKSEIDTNEEDEDEPKIASSQLEAKILEQIIAEKSKNQLSDYRILKICVGDSNRTVAENTIVGFLIIRRFEQAHLLDKHFIIPECDAVRTFDRAEIVMFRLHPLFRFQSDFIFREIARITGYWDFYYIQPIKSISIPLCNDVLTKMQPVEPRREKRKFFREADMVAFQRRASISALGALHLSDDYFAVYQHNMRSTKHFGSSDRIVIIGFNNFTKAFLRLQIFYFNYQNNLNSNMYCCVPHLNITVIAPPGVVEAEQEHFFQCDICKKQNDCYVNVLSQNAFIRDCTNRIDLSKYVKFVSGNVQKIDRKTQKIFMSDTCDIYYERLIIFASQLFGPPKHIGLNEKLPPNYQQINNRFDKIIMYYKLQTLLERLQDILPNIIVYGSNLHTFEFIDFLLKHGVKGESITLVMPLFTYADVEYHLNNPYNDTSIEIVLREMVEDLHIKIYDNVKYSHWTCYPNDENIESISFYTYNPDEFKSVMVTLKCELFVSFLEAKTYVQMVDVFKEAEIETNGELIRTDQYYRTNDPRIFAFGRNTEFKVEVNHQTRYANPKEVAEKFMEILTHPTEVLSNNFSFDEKFRQPSLCKVQLPFDYKMIKIIAPKVYLLNHLTNEYSRPMTTYKDNDFCRVRLNEWGFVEELVVVTQKDINLDFLEFFCGKHEKLLNNLYVNWSLKRFESFLEFLQEPWTELIMHDHFSELRQMNRELIIDTMKDILVYKKDHDREGRRSIARRRLADMSVPTDMEEQLFGFLRKYRKDFYYPFALPEDFPQ